MSAAISGCSMRMVRPNFIMRYKIARWLLNSYLKDNPQMAVPLEEELKEFSARCLTYEQINELRRAWQNAKFEKLTKESPLPNIQHERRD